MSSAEPLHPQGKGAGAARERFAFCSPRLSAPCTLSTIPCAFAVSLLDCGHVRSRHARGDGYLGAEQHHLPRAQGGLQHPHFKEKKKKAEVKVITCGIISAPTGPELLEMPGIATEAVMCLTTW